VKSSIYIINKKHFRMNTSHLHSTKVFFNFLKTLMLFKSNIVTSSISNMGLIQLHLDSLLQIDIPFQRLKKLYFCLKTLRRLSYFAVILAIPYEIDTDVSIYENRHKIMYPPVRLLTLIFYRIQYSDYKMGRHRPLIKMLADNLL